MNNTLFNCFVSPFFPIYCLSKVVIFFVYGLMLHSFQLIYLEDRILLVYSFVRILLDSILQYIIRIHIGNVHELRLYIGWDIVGTVSNLSNDSLQNDVYKFTEELTVRWVYAFNFNINLRATLVVRAVLSYSNFCFYHHS